MYIYEKKNAKGKAAAAVLLTLLLILIFGVFIANSSLFKTGTVLPVSQTNVVQSLKIPSVKVSDEVVNTPYMINAKTALHYFDGTKSDDLLNKAVTEFEGVYRPNQGIDYSYDGKVFETVAMLGGVVSEVKEDPLFGKTVTVTSAQNIEITYQSLSQVSVKKDQTIKQNDVIGLAGENIYNKDLGIHLHVVVLKDGKLVDPENVVGKKPTEIK